ncbi:MAG: alanine racemase, partial [Chlamydiia bacterium]|nr:alanine racemase [Chlamydiia bacterium]
NDVCEKLAAIDRLPKWRHIANSSYILSGREIAGTMVRVGISLYGLRRSYSHSTFCIGLPALSLSAPIVALHRLPPYGYVGYGRSYQAGEEGALIAILPIGYADGLRRHFREGGAFLVRGVKAPIAGNICMDYVMIDVSGIPDLQIGEQALLFGRDAMGHYIAPEKVALRGGTIVHELLAGLGSRIQRVFISGEEKHLHSLS